MIATWTGGKRSELELSAETGEWLELAELLSEVRVELACLTGGKSVSAASQLHRVCVVRGNGPTVLISVSEERREAVISGGLEPLERFGRALREFAGKMRVGQTANLEARSDDHWLDPESVTTILHIHGAVRERDGEVGG